MSRCFPFPPPGYEKKPQSDHVESLIKKHKEKKHRKEKKDKEKREGKERKDKDKDKDRSKDKHREKKDKKEKCRDKDKKKDKDRDEDEKQTLYDRKDEHIEAHNGRKPGENSHRAEDIKDTRFMDEVGRRIRDEERGGGNQVGKNITGEMQRRLGSSAEKARSTGNEIVHNITIPEKKRMGSSGEKARSTGNEIVHSITISEQKRMGSSTEKARSTGNEIVHSITIPEKKRMGSSADMARSTGNEIVHSVTIPEKKRMDMSAAMEERVTSNEMAQNVICADQTRLHGMGRPTDKDANKKIKGKTKDQDVDDKKRDKHKDKDREKKHKGKDKVGEKQREKKEKVREKEHKQKEQPRESENKDQVDSQNVISLLPQKDSVKREGTDGCFKRKEENGFLHENDVRPYKVPRPSSVSQSSLENGSKSDQSYIGNLCASDRREAVNMVRVEKTLDIKEHRINGIIDVHSPSNMELSPLVASVTENGETSKRSPHPDEKHLSQILHVPKMEEWPEFDDQEWLLSRDDFRQKPKTKLEADETPKVWAEAVRIESANVLALPYVIPY